MPAQGNPGTTGAALLMLCLSETESQYGERLGLITTSGARLASLENQLGLSGQGDGRASCESLPIFNIQAGSRLPICNQERCQHERLQNGSV